MFTKKKYHEELCNIARIKRKFIKIIRASIRMFQRFYGQHKDDKDPVLPKMIEIDEDKIKLIIGGPYQVRSVLC